MTNKIYKSAQGKSVDLGALALKNEQMLAVSPGAKVNARGDILDTNNRIVDRKSAQIGRQITQTTQPVNTTDAPIFTNSRSARASTQQTATPAAKPAPAPVQEVVDTVDTDDIVGLDTPIQALAPTPTSNEGLAAAIARAKNKKAKS